MRIIVLAGGADQIALIKELKRKGHYVILVDYLSNPPAKPFADKHIIASTLDTEKVKELALGEKVDLVTTVCTDQALLTVAKVSEELSLPCYISYDTALKVTNKQYMKDVLSKNNIPTAKYCILNNTEMLGCDFYSYPLVVKPVDCNSSKGVKKVMNDKELETALSEAISFSRTKTAIVEEFKDGIELSADFYVKDGVTTLLSVTGSTKIKNEDSFTILQSVYPVVSAEEEKKILKIGQEIARVFGLANCPLLIQMIYQNGELYVLEFSARMGGGSKYKLIEILSGVNIMRAYVDLILGDEITLNPEYSNRYVCMNYVYCEPGVFSSAENLEELLKEGIISHCFQYKTIGTEIIASKTSGDRPLGFIVIGDSPEEVHLKIRKIDNDLSIFDENNKDIMIHGLYPIDIYGR